jgi:hypothetical protein
MDTIVAEAKGAPPDFLPVFRPVRSLSFLALVHCRQRKMLRLNIPTDAVKHKITRDQVDPKLIACVLADEDLSASTMKSALSAEEDKLIEGYRNMLKVSFPEAVLRHNTKRDQASDTVVLCCVGPVFRGRERGCSQVQENVEIKD